MTEMNVKTSSAAVDSAIKDVAKSAGAYNAAVQTAILAVIRHSQAYDDCTGAGRLLAAMPRSNRRSLVIAHFAQFSPINVRKDGDEFKASLRKQGDKAYNAYNVEGAAALNWWERPEADKLPDVLDLNAIKGDFDNFIKRELGKADKAKAEAEAHPEGSSNRVNGLREAAEMRSFVERIRDMVSLAKAPASVLTPVAEAPAVELAA